MTLTFPASPTTNQSFTASNNIVYVWDGVKWVSSPSSTQFDAADIDFTYPGGVQQTVQERLEQYVSVVDFGAKGDGSTDDTSAIQAAIDSVNTAGGGTVLFPAGTYYVTSAGTTLIKNGLNGENTGDTQAYCLSSYANVGLVGEGSSSIIKGAWNYQSTDTVLDPDDLLTEPWGVMIDPNSVNTDGNVTGRTHFRNLQFQNFSFAIGNLNNTSVQSEFQNLVFSTCGIGIYHRHQERNSYDGLHSMSAMALVASGGMCAVGVDGTAVDPVSIIDEGGLTDKCNFTNINLSCLTQVKAGGSYRQFDEWFDTYCARWNLVTQASKDTNAVNARYPHQGLCGRALYVMSRYSRPNNSNWIGQISGAKLLRACVQIEAANVWNNDGVIYAETIGYTNVPDRDQGPVGGTYQDPYLPRVRTGLPNPQYFPANSRTPYAVKGIGCVLDLQRCHLDSINNVLNSPVLPRTAQADVLNPQTYLEREALTVKGDFNCEGNASFATIETDDSLFAMGKGGRYQYQTSAAAQTKTTDITAKGGNNGRCALLLCSRGRNANDADSVIYLVNFEPSSGAAPTYVKIAEDGVSNWVSTGITADPEPLITVNGGNRNCRFTFFF